TWSRSAVGKSSFARSPAARRRWYRSEQREPQVMLLSGGNAPIDMIPTRAADGRPSCIPAIGGSCCDIAVVLGRLTQLARNEVEPGLLSAAAPIARPPSGTDPPWRADRHIEPA